MAIASRALRHDVHQRLFQEVGVAAQRGGLFQAGGLDLHGVLLELRAAPVSTSSETTRAKSRVAVRTSTGRVKSRKVRTTRSSRVISWAITSSSPAASGTSGSTRETEQFQAQRDGVERVFDFVGDPRR